RCSGVDSAPSSPPTDRRGRPARKDGMIAMQVEGSAGLESLAELARVGLDSSTESIDRMLSLARAALDMDVAFISAFADGEAIVEAADGDLESFGVQLGTQVPLVETYCQPMLKGCLPSVIRCSARSSDR